MEHTIFDQIVSIENLFSAWNEFKKGKRKKLDVQMFEYELEDNLFRLNWLLQAERYEHGGYQKFSINDPKPRIIHKACVRDRIVHHAVFRVLYPIFDKSFIGDSYSCRVGKGTHRAVKRLELFAQNMSRNYRQPCFVLLCDIAKFFDTIDHRILTALIEKKIKDTTAMDLIGKIIQSYQVIPGQGVPLGNLTSQLFANVYMNEFDQFAKRELKIKRYIRYTDDFIFAHNDKEYLRRIVPVIKFFLAARLKLQLHQGKSVIRKLAQGIDFLGYEVFPYHTILRTSSKRRMYNKIRKRLTEFNLGEINRFSFNQMMQSYYGILRHCRGRGQKRFIDRMVASRCFFV